MDTIARFTGKAQVYQKYRPNYPKAYLNYLAGQLPKGAPVADVGAGTGILSQELVQAGFSVYCVEPNRDMRQEASKVKGVLQLLDGTAEQTGLPADSVCLVTAAQAFHWFEPELFRDECRRILRPNGLVSLVWNTRLDSPLNRALEEVKRKYFPDYKGPSGGISRTDKDFSIFFTEYEHHSFPNPYQLDREGFIGNLLSSSYVTQIGSEAYLEAVEDIFTKFSQDGVVEIENVTDSYTGRV